ncbi:NUDIX hydrolase [Propionibacteriaceae bacterium Y2011]
MTGRRTDAVPPAPARPVLRRRTARVIMVDPADRVLLFADSDPGLPAYGWWVTPGGGIDAGETAEQAAVREVAEETGAVITEDQLIGPLARRHVVHGYSDQVVDIDELFYGVRVDAFEVDITGHTVDEQLTLTGNRWWPRAELATTDAWLWPNCLPRLADRVAGHLAGVAVACEDLGEMEESTLAVEPAESADDLRR